MPLTLAQARELVKTNCAATADPVLTDAEVEQCLADTARATAWTASTAYAYGTLLAPTARTGHFYRVRTAGTSGASEPAWGTTVRGLTGDNTITYEEWTVDSADLYDVRAATHAAIRLKMAKASAYYSFSADGQSFTQHQVTTNLQSLLRLWVPAGVN